MVDQGLQYRINEHFCMGVHYLTLDSNLRGTMPSYPFNVFKQNGCEDGFYMRRLDASYSILICEEKEGFTFVPFKKNHRFTIPKNLSLGLGSGSYTLLGSMDNYELRRGHVSLAEFDKETDSWLDDLENIQKRK